MPFLQIRQEHALGRFNGGMEDDCVMSNSIFGTGNTPNDAAAAFSGRRRFPLRTLMICFTIWLIATEMLVFDQVKFDARAELLEQAARAFHAPQAIVPSERPSNLPMERKMQRL